MSMISKPINKSNPKNIYCDHCEHFGSGERTYFCKNPDSKRFLEQIHYWNRCKCFEWKKGGNYVQS